MKIANQILRSILAMLKKWYKYFEIMDKENIYIRSGVFHESFFTDARANSQKIGRFRKILDFE